MGSEVRAILAGIPGNVPASVSLLRTVKEPSVLELLFGCVVAHFLRNLSVSALTLSRKKGGTFMITKRMCGRILFGSASTLLVSAMAFAQYLPGGAGQQQPNMPNQQHPRTPTTGTMGPDTSLANQQAMADQAFVRKALEGGAAEVQLGRLAQQKSQSDDVKQFGQKMVEDHTELG